MKDARHDRECREGQRTRGHKHRARSLPVLPVMIYALAGTAWAQTIVQPSPAPSDDIVVTAQKRSERLQDVPISITAIKGDELARERITRPNDLASVIPNLQVSNPTGTSTPVFSLRGVSMSDSSNNQDGPVAVYYDEVYKGSIALLGVGLFDLDRVEVLRGPQGTLYGKNTTGGAINFVSIVPDFTTSGNLSVGYGNYNRYEASGAAQTALGDTIAIRVAGTFSRADGWFRNRLPGHPNLNQERQYGLRGSLLFKPSDRFNLILRASTSYQNPHDYGIYAQPEAEGIGADLYAIYGIPGYYRAGLSRRQIEANFTPRRRNRTNSVSATANWKLDDRLTLTSISSWDRGALFNGEDIDGSPFDIIEATSAARTTQIAQDLRIASDPTLPLSFLAGIYYNRERIKSGISNIIYGGFDIDQDGSATATDCILGFPASCTLTNRFTQTKTSAAAYTDIVYALTDRLKLHGGLRYTRDRGRLSGFSSRAFASDGTLVANLIPGTSDDATTGLAFRTSNLSGKIGVDLKMSPTRLLYASYSRGYRGAGFNAQAFFVPGELTVAKPEKLDAYEAGFKSELLGRRLTLNASAFYYGYKNQQILDVVDTAQVLRNLDKSRIYGLELEARARPVRTLAVGGGLSLLNARVRKGVVQGIDVRGNRLITSPKVSASGTIDWTALELDQGTVTLHADANYAATEYYEIFNDPRLKQGPRTLINARLEARTADRRRGLALWVKNITNKTYFTSRIDASSFGFIFNQLNDPRTFGVTLDSRF